MNSDSQWYLPIIIIFSLVTGCVITYLIAFFKTKKFYQALMGKYPVENCMILFCIMVGAYCGISVIFHCYIPGSATILLTLLSTFLFSWLITKRASEREYNEKIKDVASSAYRHNKNLLIKIAYEIKLIDGIFGKTQCNNRETKSCEHINSLFRIRDSLISFKRDTEANIGDWTSIIAEEINIINEIAAKQEHKKELYVLAEFMETEPSEIKDLESQIKELVKKLDSKPMFKIILDSETKLKDEMDEYIRREITAKESKHVKEDTYMEAEEQFEEFEELEKMSFPS